MSTSDAPGGGTPADLTTAHVPAGDFTDELTRLAAALVARLPGLGAHGPSALAPGAGGATPALTAPPIPGAPQQVSPVIVGAATQAERSARAAGDVRRRRAVLAAPRAGSAHAWRRRVGRGARALATPAVPGVSPPASPGWTGTPPLRDNDLGALPRGLRRRRPVVRCRWGSFPWMQGTTSRRPRRISSSWRALRPRRPTHRRRTRAPRRRRDPSRDPSCDHRRTCSTQRR